MTPFGERMRKMRAERGVTLKQMAADLGVSSAYLSALEHGKRGRPGWHLLQHILDRLLRGDREHRVAHSSQRGAQRRVGHGAKDDNRAG